MKRHDTDLVSLVFALIFGFVAALWPLWRSGVLDPHALSWVPATALIAIGLIGLALSVNASRRPSPQEPSLPGVPYGSDPAYDLDATADRRSDEQQQS